MLGTVTVKLQVELFKSPRTRTDSDHETLVSDNRVQDLQPTNDLNLRPFYPPPPGHPPRSQYSSQLR